MMIKYFISTASPISPASGMSDSCGRITAVTLPARLASAQHLHFARIGTAARDPYGLLQDCSAVSESWNIYASPSFRQDLNEKHPKNTFKNMLKPLFSLLLKNNLFYAWRRR